VIARPVRTLPSLAALALALLLAACSGAPASPNFTTGPASPVTTMAPSVEPTTAPSASAQPSVAPTEAALFPVTLTDDEGGTVELAEEPEQIVTLTPAATETLFELGVGDRIVGKVEDFTPFPDAAAAIPDVAKFGSVDVEQIVGLETDLVIAGGDNFNPPEAIAQLRDLGIPVLVVFAPDVETALADIELIGQAVGRPDEAAAIVEDVQADFDAVAAATEGTTPVRTFYELDASAGYFGPAPDYFGTEMIRIAGGDPLTSGTDGVYQVEAEQILDFDPEVILLGDAAYGVTPEQVAERPGWDVLTAVKDGAVRPIDDVIVTRPGPRLGEGIRALALAINPDLVLP
jgi:iron complex transport system substrate-binding protein